MIAGHRVGVEPRIHISVSTTSTFVDGLDLIAVERVVNGGSASLTEAEKAEVGRRLEARGIPYAEIGRRIGLGKNATSEWAKKSWAPKKQPQDEVPLDLGSASHGRSGYSLGCRCGACRKGAREASRRRRHPEQQLDTAA